MPFALTYVMCRPLNLPSRFVHNSKFTFRGKSTIINSLLLKAACSLDFSLVLHCLTTSSVQSGHWIEKKQKNLKSTNKFCYCFSNKIFIMTIFSVMLRLGCIEIPLLLFIRKNFDKTCQIVKEMPGYSDN